MKQKAVVVRKQGGPEVLGVEEVNVPQDPGKGQVLIRQTAIGVNHEDVYYRQGLYKVNRLPFIPGVEACGVVEKIGPGVSGFDVGQKVAYATLQAGSYCERRLMSAHHLIIVPNEISDQVAASVLWKGLYAHALLYRVFRVKAGMYVLIHDVTSGLGYILAQWAKIIGARVIGTVDSEEKIGDARRYGCDHPIVYTKQSISQEVAKITRRQGVPVVYDTIGKAVFEETMKSLQVMGLYVGCGQSSGPLPPVDILSLAPKGIFITRPTVMLYKIVKMELVLTGAEVFHRIFEGKLVPDIKKTYSMDQIVDVHKNLEAGLSIGSEVISL